MNTKQKAVLVFASFFIVLLLGLKTSTTFRLSEVVKSGGPKVGNTSLFLYGNEIISSGNSEVFACFLNIGEYKIQAIASVVLLATVFFVVLRTGK